LAPAYTVRWHYGPFPTTLLETAMLVSFIAFAVEVYLARPAPAWRTPFTTPAAVFLVAGAIAVAASPGQVKGLGLYRAYVVGPVVFFFVLVNAVRSHRQGMLVLAGLALGGAVAGTANAVVVIEAILHHTLNLALPPPVVIYNTQNA